ncbi:MAG: hypothetical protein C4B58_13960 [Deltaproteobacteria bacterium]|nr:MAG: hypothetical protein C4B58_13960 [Deltaproteobacteria bacterium]
MDSSAPYVLAWVYQMACNRSHSLAANRLLQGFNRGQGCTKRRILNGLCFETRKRLLAVREGEVNDYNGVMMRLLTK